MKKVLAVLLALALTLATMTVALANPSISDLSAAVVAADQLTKLPDGTTITTPDGTTALPDGSAIKLPAGVDSLPAGTSALPAGTEIVQPNGETLILPDGAQITLAEDVAKTAGGGIMIRPAEPSTYQNDKVGAMFHGTGDLFSSTVIGEIMRGKDWKDAMRIAADYTAHTIQVTLDNPKKPWYGVDFEATIPYLINME